MELPNSRHALDLIAHGDLRQQVRAHGFATRSNVPYTRHPGRTSGIALPLFDGGEPIGAMTVIYFATAMRMAEAVNRLLPDMRDTARAIEARSEERRVGKECAVRVAPGGRRIHK